MRRVHRLAFSSISIFLHLRNSAALRIDPPLPSSVVRLDPVPFTWFRDASDPDRFGFLKIQLEGPESGPSDFLTVRDAESKESGSFTLTFTTPSPFLVVGVDRDDRKHTFFTAPGTLVALRSAIVITSSSSSSSESNPSPSQTRSETNSTSSQASSSTAPTTQPTSSTDTTRAISSRGTMTVPQATSTNSSLPIPQDHQKSKKGAIVGGVVGGVATLIVVIAFIFFLLRQRKRTHENSNLGSFTPYIGASESGRTTSMDTRDNKLLIIGRQREQLERQLEAYERAPRHPHDNATEIGAVDGVNDAVQALRYQIELLTNRLTRLEGERPEPQPPDYFAS